MTVHLGIGIVSIVAFSFFFPCNLMIVWSQQSICLLRSSGVLVDGRRGLDRVDSSYQGQLPVRPGQAYPSYGACECPGESLPKPA
uniref:Secreted protein n=1 Tax=Steinernema glaseri TaxID=37863 RepID=A0A1I7YBJ7_9BILA